MENGVMRMSALAGGALVQQQGIEAIINVYGRDRNRMALQGDLLAAHVLGIQNVIVVQGEDIAQSDHREAKAVDDLDTMALIDAISGLQKGKDMAGFDLDGRPEFTIGCALSPWADKTTLDEEMDQAKRKIDAGAQFVVTPPVFDPRRFADDLEKLARLKVPVMATVFLIKSVAVARYIAANEPGAHISEESIRRIRKASDREFEALKIAGETVAELRRMVQGVVIQTMGWEHRLASILDTAGL
jgi:methylenetetrahydrofolate reductase (NADPH)